MSKYIGTPVVSLSTDTVDVTGDITTTDATPEVIIINDTHEDTDGGREGKLTFKGQASGGEETTLAQIQASHDGTSDDEKGDLIFKTNDGSDGASPTEAMRIDSSQNVGIGTDSPSAQFHIVGDDATDQVIIENTDASSASAPDLVFYRNSASPADDDLLGRIDFQGNDSAGNATDYGVIICEAEDVTDGSEAGRLKFYVASAGEVAGATDTEALTIVSPEDIRLNISADTSDTTNLMVIGGTSGHSALLLGDTADVDVGRILYDHTNDKMEFKGNALTRMVIDQNGAIGIGTTDPTGQAPSNLTGTPNIVGSGSSGATFIAMRNDTTISATNKIGSYLIRSNDSSGVKFGGMVGTADDTAGNFHLDFYPGRTDTDTSGTEPALRINDGNSLWQKSGNYYLGRTDDGTYAGSEVFFGAHYSADTFTYLRARNGTGGDYVFIAHRSGTVKSEIEENGDFLSATNSYGSTSDERLKENIEASGSQWDDIKALQVKKYSMKDEDLDAPNMLGVIAQDLQASGMNGLVKTHIKKDAEDNPILDDDGNEQEFLSVKYTVLYMKAVKALQEAMTRIETLETKVAALEGE